MGHKDPSMIFAVTARWCEPKKRHATGKIEPRLSLMSKFAHLASPSKGLHFASMNAQTAPLTAPVECSIPDLI